MQAARTRAARLRPPEPPSLPAACRHPQLNETPLVCALRLGLPLPVIRALADPGVAAAAAAATHGDAPALYDRPIEVGGPQG